jgi:hypothetical protein
MANGDPPTPFDGLSIESDQINSRMQEIYRSLYAIFGAVLPGLLAIFTFVAKEASGNLKIAEVAALFIVAFCLASLWSSNLWMELFPLIRYKYKILQPEIFALTGREGRPNFVTFNSPRRLILWTPNVLFSLVSFPFACTVWLRTVPFRETLLWWGSLVFLLAALVGLICVYVEARRLEGELTGGKGPGGARA